MAGPNDHQLRGRLRSDGDRVRKRNGGCMQRGRIMRRAVPLLIGMALSLSACAEKHYERVIVIDPGHGGSDPGAIGSTGHTLEKEVALRMGLALRDQLEATGRYQVIMTRDEDRFVRLHDRLEIARQSQGELFISLRGQLGERAGGHGRVGLYAVGAGLQ
jgi:N-acetylmuramoyl-L-alanine amidase